MKKSVSDIDVLGKRCLVRVDFNVPLDAEKNVTDDTRLVGALPTVKYLIEKGARVILASHLGRPKGVFNEQLSLAPVAAAFSQLLGKPIRMATEVVGEEVKKMADELRNGEVMMLENTRFVKGEEANDDQLSKQLAELCDVYVNDAFGTAHRAHASTAGVAKYVPVAVGGFLISREIEIMDKALSSPERPFVVILGGAKVSDKIGVIRNLLDKADYILIGGGMAYTFFKALGYNIGTSICQNEKLELAKELIEKAKEKKVNFMLPVDTVVADKFGNDAHFTVMDSSGLPDDMMGMDIGPLTTSVYCDIIKRAKTIIWNGPMGVFEMSNFAHGTYNIAKAMADNTDCVSIVGGGDSAAAVTQMGFKDKITHISTGGGACLEFLEGLVLPGIDCLNNK
jgi:3-phosphoglycerate kinase